MERIRFSRARRIVAIAAVLLAGLIQGSPAALATSLQEKLSQADVFFDQAETQRVELEGIPADQRTFKDYSKVIRSYHRVYDTAPTSLKTTKSLMEMGKLYRDMGRDLGASKYYLSAVETYDFLMKEYPHSQYRAEALLATARIFQSDLKQPESARKLFQLLIQKHPRSEEAEAARAGIAEMNAIASGAPEPASASAESAPLVLQTNPEFVPARSSSGRVAVTGVREWVTPASTRIVIDLGDEVKYEVGKVGSPSRIFVDLFGTKIDTSVIRELRSKTNSESGLIRNLRAGQNKLDVTRVVAEIDSQTDYSVIDLPNPYRLIIELRGRGGKEDTPPEESRADHAGPVSQAAAPTSPKNGNSITSGKELTASAPRMAAKQEEPLPKQSRDNAAPIHAASGSNGPQSISAITEANADFAADDKPAAVSSDAKRKASEPSAPNGAAAETPSASLQPAQSKPNDPRGKPGRVSNSPEKITRWSAVVHAPPAASKQSGTISNTSPNERNERESAAADARISAAGEGIAAPSLEPGNIPSSESPDDIAADGAITGNDALASPKRVGRPQAYETARAALPNRDGTRSLTRALGLKIGRIIIDPGHGGHDTGTVGPSGLAEKDLVLDVSQRLGKLISDRMGSEVVYTRQDDTFVPLETRTAIANEKQADLFLSIHANSSPSRNAKGIETYYLSIATDSAALEVAARENAVSQESIHELQDIVRKIALYDKVDESREFATDVQAALHDRLGKDAQRRKDRGVKKAPFVVLVGARMPSALAEIAFLSNPLEEKLLRTKAQRQKIAEALYTGVAKYAATLSGLKVAAAGSITSNSLQ